MEPAREGDLEIDLCPLCMGLWFDGEELKRFLPTQQLARGILSQQAKQQPKQRVPRVGQRCCPRCHDPLRESPVGGGTGRLLPKMSRYLARPWRTRAGDPAVSGRGAG